MRLNLVAEMIVKIGCRRSRSIAAERDDLWIFKSMAVDVLMEKSKISYAYSSQARYRSPSAPFSLAGEHSEQDTFRILGAANDFLIGSICSLSLPP